MAPHGQQARLTSTEQDLSRLGQIVPQRASRPLNACT
jgi:hypothetical protein